LYDEAFASRYAGREAPEMAAWKRAVDNSDAMRIVRERAATPGPNQEYYQYLARPQEVFARSYAQWIAEKNQGDILGQLYNYPHGEQWFTDEFKPIAKALDDLFRAKGLM
jgi:hypothetical protein